jgi:nitroreductase
MTTGFLNQLQWRSATKKFDATQQVPEPRIQRVLEAIHQAPTSFGLQPFYVKDIRDPSTKSKLQAAGWNQPQFSTANSVLVFVARRDVENRITEMAAELKRANPEDASIDSRMKMMHGFFKEFSPEQKLAWAQRQSYIALGFAMAACAELQIDSCPMEGFSPEAFNEILDIPSEHHVTVALTLGQRDSNPSNRKRFRFPFSSIIQAAFLVLLNLSCQSSRANDAESNLMAGEIAPNAKVATSTIYNNAKYNIVTVYHPTAGGAFRGDVVNTNSKSFEPLPRKFVMGDGLLTRAFLYVDSSNASPLSIELDKIVTKLPRNTIPNRNRILDEITMHLESLTGDRWLMGVNQEGDNPWDPIGFQIDEDASEAFRKAGEQPVGHDPISTGQSFPMVNFERFLTCNKCSAYCLQKAVLAKLILDRLKIPSRLVTGFLINMNDSGFTTDGHSWVEVKDGRSAAGYEILDPTWKKRALPGPRNEIDRDWIMFSEQYRVANQNWPVLKLND